MDTYRERTAEIAIYNGEKYRRYPDSTIGNSKNYYTRYKGNGRRESLHVVVYRDNIGPIPEGHHIHHKDENPLNNAPENLECVDGKEHCRRHAKKLYDCNKAKGIDNLYGGSLKIKETEGNKGEEAFKRREPIECTCKVCGSIYLTKFYSKPSFFCSGKCKAKYRRDTKQNMEDRVCSICGEIFKTDKYKTSKTCSNSCANYLRWDKRRQVVI